MGMAKAYERQEELARMDEKSKLTFEQRLERLLERHEALAQSVEALTHDIAEMQAGMQRMDARERQGRLAIVRGIEAYLSALDGDDG